MSLSPGQTIAHYRIASKIGEGGMGEVYRAEDTKLGRHVALKVLPAEMASSADRLSRFQREARAVAALNHPNIVTLYSVEESGGTHFLTMELVEGEPLKQRIPSDGMELPQFFELAVPLTAALAAAHERGITHRDLKPSNVMVGDGGVLKVLDFGLAKLMPGPAGADVSRLETEAVTQEGLVVGTLPYMSPEQIEGRRVDHRTDIFSLGIMLHEMLTGSRPFGGGSPAALMSSIMKDTPQPVTEGRPGLPRHLARVVGRCLSKAPGDRYQTARDVHNELKALREEGPAARVEEVPSGPAAPWIAVLPFKSGSGDPEMESFADGLTEDVTTGLARFSYLFVVALNSTMRYKGQSIDIRKVGEEVGARYVIEGSVRRAGDRIRLGVQAIESATGTHLWAETYNRDLGKTDIFSLQDELTDRIVATIADASGVVVRAIAAPTAEKPPQSLSPYECVLRYFIYQNRLSEADHLVTRTALELAVEREPRNADVLACLALTVLEESRHSFNERPGALERCLDYARRAVDSDRANQIAQQALAQAHYYCRDLGSFRPTAERAVRLNPRDSQTLAMMGILTSYSGEWERGVEMTRQARRLNPHHPGWYRFSECVDHYRKGEYAESLAVVQHINMPTYFSTHMMAAACHAWLGDSAAATQSAQALLRIYPDFARRGCVEHLEPWWFAQPEVIEKLCEGLRKAGIPMTEAPG